MLLGSHYQISHQQHIKAGLKICFPKQMNAIDRDDSNSMAFPGEPFADNLDYS